MRSTTKVLAVLVAVLVALVVAYVVIGPARQASATAAGPDVAPLPADGAAGYAGGSLPEGRDVAVSAAVTAVPLALGYDYRTLDAGLEDATALMTDAFAAEFRDTFERSAAELARDQQAVTKATVRAAGLASTSSTGGDSVVVLVYVDQVLASSTTVKDRDNPVEISQNRVLVGLVQTDGRWLVDSIEPF